MLENFYTVKVLFVCFKALKKVLLIKKKNRQYFNSMMLHILNQSHSEIVL